MLFLVVIAVFTVLAIKAHHTANTRLTRQTAESEWQRDNNLMYREYQRTELYHEDRARWKREADRRRAG
jgi:hypothetical protein